MPNINKRYLGIAALMAVMAFFAGSQMEKHQQQKTSIMLDLTTENSQTSAFSEQEPELMQVYVHGEVLQPGVYYLAEDARVHEAIEKAGGLLATAYRKNLNLASRLRDGETLYIPSIEEGEAQAVNGSEISAYKAGSRININSATVVEMQRLPGIGPTLAQRIVDYRNKNGYFKRIEDVKNVNGIGDKRFDEIKDQIDV